jgi:hypothetical protein
MRSSPLTWRNTDQSGLLSKLPQLMAGYGGWEDFLPGPYFIVN